jgi:fimbrial isopeptide formation D2 family protein/LPXTG-motif cell wall-anchored protein
MKKIFALAIALVMVFAMSATAFAATTVTINPGNPNGDSADPTYTYYVMMKASVGESGTAYYVESQALATALDGLTAGENNADLFTVTKASGADRWNVVINKNGEADFTGEEVAAALATIKSNAIATGTATNNQISLEYDGYILIESSLGTKLVVDTVTTKEINEKNTYPSLTKTESTTNAEIGGTVTYLIPVVIPATVAEKPIVVTDIITKGLTLNTAITADNDVTGLEWTLDSTDATTQAKTYKVTIPAATVKALAGKTLTLTYTATVNELAVVNEAETNKAHLDYDNFTSVDTDPTEIKTFGFDLQKTDGTNALAGVKFTLQNSANEYYTEPSDDESVDEDRFVATKYEVTTPEDGKITFAGLAVGTYTLTETETVTGFNLLTGPITVTVAADGSVTFSGDGQTANGTTVTVVNQQGSVLPSTGGMGTTIFYAIGAILVIGAGVVLVSRRRAN